VALQVGQVLYLPCKSCVEKGRLKFQVVAFTWPEPHFFLINSDQAPLASAKPTIARTQVRILQAEHSAFLRKDSWLDCSILKNDYIDAEITALLAADTTILRGVVSENCRAGVRAALIDNKLLAREHLTALRGVWA
jgi:hypothetical protein